MQAYKQRRPDLILLDIWMPDTDGISLLKEWADSGSLGPVVMMSGHGTVDTAVEATRLGALDFIEKPVSLSQLLRTVSKALSRRRPGRGSVQPERSHGLVGKSQAMRALREKIQAAAQHDTHLLFTGEPGSGRALSARSLAGLSRRARAPFETVEGSRLTGPDAVDLLSGPEGALKRAQGGTLFIADIEKMSAHAQRALFDALRGDTGDELYDARLQAVETALAASGVLGAGTAAAQRGGRGGSRLDAARYLCHFVR